MITNKKVIVKNMTTKFSTVSIISLRLSISNIHLLSKGGLTIPIRVFLIEAGQTRIVYEKEVLLDM